MLAVKRFQALLNLVAKDLNPYGTRFSEFKWVCYNNTYLDELQG